MTPILLSRKDLIKVVGMAYSTIWRLERSGSFPKRRTIAPNRVGWLYSEIEEWANSRKAA